ncbi:DUF2523 domain-containing protein [Shewanella sp. 4t3-1-2LB]|uniref:DUF2523 domain-containing protein n=1 Tax=Shewanella sp. 4t3-1-2LB TaxID=2817682 RepID=UPI001A999886|nr:DUF2523 domain-containing protein [Shewanella sp. 4t3-1-2LB]MBO1271196.1 DUF2523 domain-containing protein [Shewanella sp. 4t3-1-2LB]
MQFFYMLLVSIFPFLAATISAMVARIAVSLGFGTVTYFGVNLIFDKVIERLNSSQNFIYPQVATFIHLLGIDTAINIMLSAGVGLLVLKGVSKTGEMRKSVWRKPGDKTPISWDA